MHSACQVAKQECTNSLAAHCNTLISLENSMQSLLRDAKDKFRSWVACTACENVELAYKKVCVSCEIVENADAMLLLWGFRGLSAKLTKISKRTSGGLMNWRLVLKPLNLANVSHTLTAFGSLRWAQPNSLRSFKQIQIQHLDLLMQTFASSSAALLSYSQKGGRAENEWQKVFGLGILFTTSRRGEVDIFQTTQAIWFKFWKMCKKEYWFKKSNKNLNKFKQYLRKNNFTF